MLFGIEEAYCNAMLGALVEARNTMLDTSISEAVRSSHVPHKGDTLGLDQRPENTITSELRSFDQYAIVITEERGEDVNPFATAGPETVHGARTFYCCDPCDRSLQLQEFFRKYGKDQERVADVLRRSDAAVRWERDFGRPAVITGANVAITCVRRGLPVCSAILNYITDHLAVACSAGIYTLRLPRRGRTRMTLDLVRARGKPVDFPPLRDVQADGRRVVTFIGKPERGYPQNFLGSKLVEEYEINRYLHYDQPGGPTRILYLSALQAPFAPIGMIVANGEKIGEWIHWFPFIRFAHRHDDWGAKALRVFEIAQEQSLMRDGYLMAPSYPYSAFVERNERTMVIDVERLRGLHNPSRYRATLIVIPSTNKWAMSRVEQYGYRELVFD